MQLDKPDPNGECHNDVAMWGVAMSDFGTSANGSLTLTTLLRAKMERLPMPGAIAPRTPTVDLTKTGDSLFTNEMIDTDFRNSYLSAHS